MNIFVFTNMALCFQQIPFFFTIVMLSYCCHSIITFVPLYPVAIQMLVSSRCHKVTIKVFAFTINYDITLVPLLLWCHCWHEYLCFHHPLCAHIVAVLCFHFCMVATFSLFVCCHCFHRHLCFQLWLCRYKLLPSCYHFCAASRPLGRRYFVICPSHCLITFVLSSPSIMLPYCCHACFCSVSI